MIGCKVMRTLASVEIEIMLILGLPYCLSSSSMRCLESVSKIVAGRDDWLIDVGHACLNVARTSTESEPFEGEARTPESPHILAPPKCHVEESEGFGTFVARSTSSDSTVPLLPDHPLTHTTPVLFLILCKTARIVVRVLPLMSAGLSAGMAEVAAMSDSAFHKRFRSSYDSLPSLTLLVRKRESEDIEDEGPTADDEDLAVEDEGLSTRVEGPDVDDESYGLGGRIHGVDDEIHGLDDESYGINGEGRGIESDRLGLGEEEAVREGQQRAVLVVGTAVSEHLGLGYGSLRHRELVLEKDHVYSTFEVGQGYGSAPEPRRSERVSTFRHPTLTTWTDREDGMVYIDVPVYPPPAPPVQTPPSPEWTSGSLPISPSPSVVPSPVSSHMILLTVPSPIASPMATSTTTILVDDDQFIEVGAQLKLYRGILQDHTHRLDVMPPTLFAKIDRDVRELYTRSGNALERELQEMRDRVTVLEQERDRKERYTI
uniref:Uncharacterized protein n=1 Tax=Tanacetum cinerariifolium TaxID=118510 RepID=A0A6L2JAA9_TANCI|nr:hypothetical protein [Tanacetum cinerariifolium]